MKADREKTSGAKIAPFYNAQDEYLCELEKDRYRNNSNLHGGDEIV